MNTGIVKMVTVTVSVFFIVHLIGCMWFLQAKFDDFTPDCWVVKFGYQDKEASM